MESLDGRMRRLEDILGGAVGTPEEREAKRRRTEEKRAAIAAKLRRIREQAEREEAEGDGRRLRALEDLEEASERWRSQAQREGPGDES